MKIAIICPDYPSENSSAFAFVHQRAKWYLKFGHAVEVFVIQKQDYCYQFEGVVVHKTQKPVFANKVDRFAPDVLAVHFATWWMIPTIQPLPYPKVVWVLGHEVLWSFRLMSSKNKLDWVKKRLVLLPRLMVQLRLIRRFLHQADSSVFVSNYLLRAAEKHTLARFKNACIIPNAVDTRLFSYKEPANFTKGISVRSLERSVYGLDVAIKAFSNLESASLAIYGCGRYFHKYSKMITKYRSNTTIHSRHIQHHTLPELYQQFGFFVAPSRQETQGVAMCEAMACGRPVVASRVGGIPEFVRDGLDGLLVPPNDPAALQNAVLELISDKKRFLQMSLNARNHIDSICNALKITEQEIAVLKKATKISVNSD
ncbi:MAG: glycosyltransferase family 4 protein [bacterium]